MKPGESKPSEPDIDCFELAESTGEVVREFRVDDLESALQLVLDPATADEILHWGRNILWVTSWPGSEQATPVVVKQFRHEGVRKRLDRRFRGSKAGRNWRTAISMMEAGIPTPQPVAWVESRLSEGPAYYICRYVPRRLEARYPLRALNAGELTRSFPELSQDRLFADLAQLARRIHRAGYWHRDFSAGNVLLAPLGVDEESLLVDLNRARQPRRLGLGHRMADLSRMPLHSVEDRRSFLTEYLGRRPSSLEWWVYRRHFFLFHGRHRVKKGLRRRTEGIKSLLFARKAYPHLPAPEKDASKRDRAVWDGLSDQPHQHATRWEKLAVRLGDLGVHIKMVRATFGALPRIWRRYRLLKKSLHHRPIRFEGLGVCLRPLEGFEGELLEAVEDLGVRYVLLRLHPWQTDHDAEEELARELTQRGIELAFALPQRRELVRDLDGWKRSIEHLADRFTPYGKYFQVGHAINRSKWGVWNLGEFQALAAVATEVLRCYPEVQILGPGVIDFEFHVTAAVLNWPGQAVEFDVAASLLYVDRRGAPENRQAGFDTVDKAVLAQAIAETGKHVGPRSWITEVNWPLREGPHSPAGRHVSVDEETYADYLVRYYLLALGSGCVERVYWWQLEARGYGLMVLHKGNLRRRAGFQALKTMVTQLQGLWFQGPLATDRGIYLYHFKSDQGSRVLVGWCVEGERSIQLPGRCIQALTRDGSLVDSVGSVVRLSPSVQYFELEEVLEP